MNRFCASFLVGVGLSTVAGAGQAEGSPGQVSVRWSAPDECPDDARLLHQIETLLGKSLLEFNAQTLRVRASAQGNAEQGYAGKISFSSELGDQERYLDHPSCDRLVEAMALVIALAIDPERVQAARDAEDAGSAAMGPTPAAAPSSATSERCPPAMPPEPPHEHEACHDPAPRTSHLPLRGLRAAVHGLAGAGALPGFGGGMEAALGWQPEGFRVELLGRYWVPRSQSIGLSTDGRLDLALATLGARACWLLPVNAWRFSACGGADLGNERATGVALENSRSRDALYAQASGSLEVASTRSRLVPEGGVEVSGALLRPRFGISRDGSDYEVFKPASWSFSALFGFAFEL